MARVPPWSRGLFVVEYEQSGADRAAYGARLLPALSADIGKRGIKGLGVSVLERTGLSRDKARVLARAQKQESLSRVADLIHDPYVLEFTGLAERSEYSENDLETALLDHLQSFLLELGAGFCFGARQKRITLGNEHDYVDLIFYHPVLRCHVLIDLKIRPFRHQDVGQMNFYLNWAKAHLRAPGDLAPVGMILCSDREKTKVEYATSGLSNKVFVSRYLTVLPPPELLSDFLRRDRERIDAGMLQALPPGG